MKTIDWSADVPSAPQNQAARTERPRSNEQRCVQCDAPAPDAVCGRKIPCPECGFPYPLGDCSDLAEN